MQRLLFIVMVLFGLAALALPGAGGHHTSTDAAPLVASQASSSGHHGAGPGEHRHKPGHTGEHCLHPPSGTCTPAVPAIAAHGTGLAAEISQGLNVDRRILLVSGRIPLPPERPPRRA